MPRRPPGDGRLVARQQKYALTLLALLALANPLVEAQQQRQQQQPSIARVLPVEQIKPIESFESHDARSAGRNNRQESPLEAGDYVAQQNLAAATASAQTQATVESPPNRRKRTATSDSDDRPQPNPYINSAILIPEDASALATLAPEPSSVRAPLPPAQVQEQPSIHNAPSLNKRQGGKNGGSTSVSSASQQSARSLEDWEVEDYVLLATVNGDLHAADRKTGTARWTLEVEQPMVETKHFRTNASVLDEDYSPEDHYIWAVEPNHDGRLYLWIPSETSAGLINIGLSMKKLVE
jgi:serine/threonine-protein kinase/endoribonuclease IRE1